MSGKTAIAIAADNNPVTRSVLSAARTWTDANGNYMPDCDLANLSANGECGAINNTNFGRVNAECHPVLRRSDSRVGRARLPVGRVRGAAASARRGRVADGRLLPELVQQLPGHRQRRRSAGRLQPVLRNGAGRCAAAGRRRLPGVRAVRHRAGEVRPRHESRHLSKNYGKETVRLELHQRQPEYTTVARGAVQRQVSIRAGQ